MGVIKGDTRSLDDSSIRFGCGYYGAYSKTMLKGSYTALIVGAGLPTSSCCCCAASGSIQGWGL